MKKVSLFVITIIVSLFIVTGCTNIGNNITDDMKKFKEEYESLNGQTNSQDQEYLSVSIKEANGAIYASSEEILKILDNGTAVIYFGFPSCPWCRNALPVLLEALEENEVENFYYLNALEIRDNKHLEEGKIITDKEGTEEYYQLVERLEKFLPPYEGLEDDSIKRLYFPTVVFVKDGQVLGSHISTVESQEDPYVALSKDQEEELKQIYTTYIKQVQGLLCADNTKC